jgi:hypothetical protein
MTSNEVKSFGAAMLSSSYPCAMIKWAYGSYMNSSSMASALKSLRFRAQSRAAKSCRS